MHFYDDLVKKKKMKMCKHFKKIDSFFFFSAWATIVTLILHVDTALDVSWEFWI